MSENTRRACPVNPVTIARRRKGRRGPHLHTESRSEARNRNKLNHSEKFKQAIVIASIFDSGVAEAIFQNVAFCRLLASHHLTEAPATPNGGSPCFPPVIPI
jgi:hypothetical protein